MLSHKETEMPVLDVVKKRFLARQMGPRVAAMISDALDTAGGASAADAAAASATAAAASATAAAASAATATHLLTPTATHTTNQVADYGQIVVMDATSGNLTVAAPDPAGNAGRRWGMKLIATASAHTITAVAHAAETFDGGAAPSTATPGAYYEFASDGARWIITHAGL